MLHPHPHPALWAATSDRHHPDCSQPNRAATNLCTSVYARLFQVPTSSPWTPQISSGAGEVISPLEKKKRMAQASLYLPLSAQSEDKERPSVIQCSQSPARASSSQNCNPSDGSPVPLSSSSSRSPSPYSVSSEDSATGNEDKPASSSEPHNCCNSEKNASSCSEESKLSKEPAGPNKDVPQVSSQSADSVKPQTKDSSWKPSQRGSGRYFSHSFHPSSSFPVKSDWAPTSTSSFTKVIPKSMQPLRPAPIRPGYKTHPGRLLQHDEPLTCAKKLNNIAPWSYQTEKREKSRTMPQKGPSAQQSLSHSPAGLPMPCVLSSYDKSGRDSLHQPPLHPALLPNRTRQTHTQLMYRHVPMSPAHSALIGSTVFPYPYPLPLLGHQSGYTLPAMNPIYPYKL